MNWNDLAPWIAIVITVALSILVPLFTQMKSNRFQRKMMEEERKNKKEDAKRVAYEQFLKSANSWVQFRTGEALAKVGEEIGNIYLYAPERLFPKITKFSEMVMDTQYKEARKFLEEMAVELAADLKPIKK